MKIQYLSLLIAALLISGCASNNENNQDHHNDDNYLIKEDTSIDFLCMADDSYHEELQAMVDDFMKSEPHVKVRLFNPLGSGSYSAIERYIVSGFFKEDYPDIAQCFPDNVVKYLALGYALDIDPYINNETYGLVGDEKADYITSFLEEGTKYSIKGTYSLPFCKSTELMYYNADALLGVDLSAIDNSINEGHVLDTDYLDNLTWEELFTKLCPALKTYNDGLSHSEKIYIESDESAIFTYESDENFFITLASQYGYGYTHIDEQGQGHIDFENDEMKGLLKELNNAKTNGYLQTHGSNRDYVSNLFTARKALFSVSSTASLSYNYNKNDPFNIGVAKIPHPEGKDYTSINQGPSVCILDHKDENRSLASFLLWKHITNKSNSSSWSLKTGYMPIRNSSFETEEYQAAINIKEDATILEKATADNLNKISLVKDTTFNTSIFKGSGNARTNVGLLLKEVLLSDGSDETINQLFKSYADDAKSYLD